MLRRIDDVRLKVQLSNFPIIKRPHDLSVIQVQIDGNVSVGAVKAIHESTRQFTVFAVSVPRPAAGWNGDSIALKFYSDDVSRAASFVLQILSTPAPTIVRQFPLKGISDVRTQVSISIQFLEASAAPITVSGGATVSQATAKHDATCVHRDCSLYDVKITVPALVPSPPAMTDAGFVITSGKLSTFFNFTYIPAEAAVLTMAHPKVQTLGLQAGVKEIKVLLEKYPSSNCGNVAKSCAKEAVGTVVLFGGVRGTITQMTDDAKGLALTLLAPLAVKQAQVVTVQIKSLGSSSVVFDYTYASYATVRPVNGPVEGGGMVTVSAFGLHSPDSVVERTQLQIRFGEAAVAVSDIESAQHVDDGNGLPRLEVVLRTTAAAKAGYVMCTICLMPRCDNPHAVSTFVFSYYLQPSVLKIIPSKVTLDGRTDLAIGSSLVELTVLDFPKLDAIDQLQLTIADMPCNGTVCRIHGFSQSAISTKVSIQVPALTSVGLKTVRLFFQDTRSVVTQLQYFNPQPVILSAHWCKECNDGNMCMRGGLCRNGVAALKNSAKLADSTDTSNHVITIVLDNFPDTSAAEGLLVSFGGYSAPFRRVAFSSRSKIVIEVDRPKNIPEAGKLTMVVASPGATSSWSASSDFNFIDPRYVITNLESTPLAFPCSKAQPFKVSVSNLPVQGFGAADEVAVYFAGVSAQSFSIESIVGNLMTLLVTPPAFELSSTEGGFAVKFMKVTLRSDPSIFAETRVEFYGEPTFSAEFDGKGTAIVLTFNQKTGCVF
jgi:hypothetical protein